LSWLACPALAVTRSRYGSITSPPDRACVVVHRINRGANRLPLRGDCRDLRLEMAGDALGQGLRPSRTRCERRSKKHSWTVGRCTAGSRHSTPRVGAPNSRNPGGRSRC
jgi:hypothetical protein